MKTAISVPDDVFNRAAHYAARLGMSRSEFFSTAARRWVDQLDEADLTTAIDRAVANAGPDEDAQFVRSAAAQLLQANETSDQ